MPKPDLSYLKNLVLSLTGVFCGNFVGLTVGGGSLVVPPLVRYLLGTRPARSVSMSVTLFGALGGILAYAQRHHVRWSTGVVLAITQIIGVSLAERINPELRSKTWMRLIWAFAAIAGGVALANFEQPVAVFYRSGPLFPPLSALPAQILWIVVVGMCVGVLSHIMELPGILIIPACLLLLSMDPLTAQGTALAGLIVVSAAGLLIHLTSGDADRESITPMSIGSVFGGLVGGYLATQVLKPDQLVLLFGVVLTLTGLARFMSVTRSRGSMTPSGSG